MSHPPAPDPVLRHAVERLLGTDSASLRFAAQGGGVSSDIWRVDFPGGTVCAKRALPQLKVAERWLAPTRRNAEEAKWLRFAASVVPGQVPRVIADDPDEGVLLLEWFDPATWRNWKTSLLAGDVETSIGAGMGRLLGTVHAASAGSSPPQGVQRGQTPLNTRAVKAQFQNLDLFEALRIAPYFGAAAERNPAAAAALAQVSSTLRSRGTALVHGDVSPKNVLTARGKPPVLLDAECATWGDPSFDVAFLVTHLLLKAIHRPAQCRACVATAAAFCDSYVPLAGHLVDAVPRLVAALLLARVDGKSPVEYLAADTATRVRRFAVAHLNEPAHDVPTLFDAWRAVVNTR